MDYSDYDIKMNLTTILCATKMCFFRGAGHNIDYDREEGGSGMSFDHNHSPAKGKCIHATLRKREQDQDDKTRQERQPKLKKQLETGYWKIDIRSILTIRADSTTILPNSRIIKKIVN